MEGESVRFYQHKRWLSITGIAIFTFIILLTSNDFIGVIISLVIFALGCMSWFAHYTIDDERLVYIFAFIKWNRLYIKEISKVYKIKVILSRDVVWSPVNETRYEICLKNGKKN